MSLCPLPVRLLLLLLWLPYLLWLRTVLFRWCEAVEQAFCAPFSDRSPLPGLLFSERSPLPGLVFKPSQHRSVKELATLVCSQRSACPAFDVVCVHAALAKVVNYDDLLDAPRGAAVRVARSPPHARRCYRTAHS
eukprot:scaffold12843_cov71-Phaeocystis_antarctica.AAC.1